MENLNLNLLFEGPENNLVLILKGIQTSLVFVQPEQM